MTNGNRILIVFGGLEYHPRVQSWLSYTLWRSQTQDARMFRVRECVNECKAPVVKLSFSVNSYGGCQNRRAPPALLPPISVPIEYDPRVDPGRRDTESIFKDVRPGRFKREAFRNAEINPRRRQRVRAGARRT